MGAALQEPRVDAGRATPGSSSRGSLRAASAALVALLLTLTGSTGCRSEPPAPPAERWFIAVAADLPGVWESVGPQLARDGAVLRIFYAFHADGTYEVLAVTYASELSLVSGGGSWRQSAAGVDFLEDEREPYVATIRGQRLRLRAGSRTLELERVLDDDRPPDELLATPPPLELPGADAGAPAPSRGQVISRRARALRPPARAR